jgi:hypothetical protein
MSSRQWQALLLEPDRLDGDNDFAAWFDNIARRMLCGCRLLVAGQAIRLTEIEMYYHGGSHLDPFSHQEAITKNTGRWYFHRTSGVYRGGSFKGLDLSFGGPEAFGGILIRSFETDDGTLVDGPSLCVDYLLSRTGKATVALLDEAIAGRLAWEGASPLYLQWLTHLEDRTLSKTARVGLSMKRFRPSELPARFILKPYRYLSEPRRISKGKLHVVIAMHARGILPSEIRDRTGCPTGAIERWVTDYQEGITESDFTPYFGIELGPRELARLHGSWYAKYGR